MAATTAICNSFKTEVLTGLHNLSGDTLRVALIKTSMAGTYGAGTANYSDVTANADETTGTGYTAGGAALASQAVTIDGGTAFFDFGDITWDATGGTLAARAFLLYNETAGGRAIAVYDLGGDSATSNGTFTLQIPNATPTTAVLRLS